jgi:predicted  nucleic acid-binding Zn-ribbon protein
MEDNEHAGRVRVRCLDCGSRYDKPDEGGTVSRNPGCPSCGYVGWEQVEERSPQPRPAEDRPLRLIARSG